MLGRYFFNAISIVIVAVAAGWTDEYGITNFRFFVTKGGAVLQIIVLSTALRSILRRLQKLTGEK